MSPEGPQVPHQFEKDGGGGSGAVAAPAKNNKIISESGATQPHLANLTRIEPKPVPPQPDPNGLKTLSLHNTSFICTVWG